MPVKKNRSAIKFEGGGIFLLLVLLMAGLAACGGDEPTVRAPVTPVAPPFQPQPVEVELGASGEKVTLMTTEGGGFTLNGEAFESGKTVTSEGGNVYTLLLAEGMWSARYEAPEVEVKLGSLEETVKLVKGEDGSYRLGEMAVESGVTKHEAANGNVYTLVMGEDGMWMAQYQASETMLALGTSGTTVTIVRNEDGTYTVGGEPLMSGGTWTAANGGEYTLMRGEDGKWTATYVPGKGTVTVGGTGLTLVATRAEDGSWSVVNPVTGETESLSEGGQITTAGNTYTLTSDGKGKWTAMYNPMRVEVQLGTVGGTVTLVRAEDGSYWLGEKPVETGMTTVTSANGNVYTLVMGEDGMWKGRYEAPTTTVTLGTSGTMVTIVMQEDGSWTLDGEVFMSGGQHTAGNGNVYRLSRVDGVWMAEYVPMTMEVQGTGGLQAVKREDGSGYDVDGAMLGKEGMGDIETETSGWYRVVKRDGALMGTRLDNVAIGKAKFKTTGVSAHPSILGDDRKTEANEARTALVVDGENYPFGELLGDGVSQRKGTNFVSEARGKLMEIREKIVAVLDVFDTDSQRDTQVGRQWGTESANNARTNVKGVLETVFGSGKYKKRAPDDDDALGAIDDLIEALGSEEALEKALGDEDVLKESAAVSAAGKIFEAAKTESTVTYEEHGNTRFGTITKKERANAAGAVKYEYDSASKKSTTGELGAFAFGVTGETTRTRYVQTAGSARYEGRTLAVSGAGKQYSGTMAVGVNFTTSMVEGLITELATEGGESWEYLFGEVDSIVLPNVKMNQQGVWKEKSGGTYLATVGFGRGRRVGVYQPQSVAATFEGRLLGGNSAPGAGSEVVGVWSLGTDPESMSYLAGGFGAERVADEPVRRPSVDDGTQVSAMLVTAKPGTITADSTWTELTNGRLTAKPSAWIWNYLGTNTDTSKPPVGTLTQAQVDTTGAGHRVTWTGSLVFRKGDTGADIHSARNGLLKLNVPIPLEDLLASEGGELTINSPKTWVQHVRESVQEGRDKLAGLLTITDSTICCGASSPAQLEWGYLPFHPTLGLFWDARTDGNADVRGKAISGSNNDNVSGIFNHLPSKVINAWGIPNRNGDFTEAVERYDALLEALSSAEALEAAFDPEGSGLFTVTDSGTEKSFLKMHGDDGELYDSAGTNKQIWNTTGSSIFNQRQWQVKAAVGTTDYTRFGAWRIQYAKNAFRAKNWLHHEVESFVYSPLPVATARSRSQLPLGARATYTGKTVAYVGTMTEPADAPNTGGFADYEGEVSVEVQWFRADELTRNVGGHVTTVLTDLRDVETGDYLYHVDGNTVREVRRLTFSKIAFTTNAAVATAGTPAATDYKLDWTSTEVATWFTAADDSTIGKLRTVQIDYRDSSVARQTTLPNQYDFMFVGRSPEGPLGVLGRYEFTDDATQTKFHPKFRTGPDDTVNKSVYGAFGADLP